MVGTLVPPLSSLWLRRGKVACTLHRCTLNRAVTKEFKKYYLILRIRKYIMLVIQNHLALNYSSLFVMV